MTTAPEDDGRDQLRAAIAAFAADPDDRTAIDVLRHCLHGELIVDITGSQLTMVDGEPAEVVSGANLQIHSVTAPDGATAVLAFTSSAELERIHPPGTETMGLGQPATAIVEFAHSQAPGWLYLDVGGVSCGLSPAQLELAAAVPRNDAVREALGAVADDPQRRPELIGALRAEGVLLLAADPLSLAEGDEAAARIRGSELPDGRQGLLAFTSAPELLARAPGDAVVIRSTGEVLAMLGDDGYAGLVLNPAGPFVALTHEDLLG